MPGIYNEQKIYDALSNSSKEKGNESSIFDTEYSRKYYLDSITVQDLNNAIAKLERPDYAGVSLRDEMIKAMKEARDSRGKVNTSTQQSTQALSQSVSNSATKTAAAPESSATPSIRPPEALPTEKELFSKAVYTLNGTPVKYEKLDVTHDGKYTPVLTLAHNTQLTLSLIKNTDGTWKAVESTTTNYTVEISPDKKIITIVSKSPVTKPAAAPAAAPATKPANATTRLAEEPKTTPAKPAEEKSDKKKVEKSDDIIKSENIAYIKANKVPTKSADGKRDISAQLSDPTKATIKKLQEDMGMRKEDQDGQI